MSQAGSFGVSDYWRMLSARGPRMPWQYFREAHLFDLVHGTDTHARVTLDRFTEQPETFEHGVLYMCSWTSEVVRSFGIVRDVLGDRFEHHAFVDIGCGKGKASIVWARECARRGLAQRVVGMDYIGDFVRTAERNAAQLLLEGTEFIQADAASFDYSAIGRPLILYLYNPFDGVLLERVLQRLQGLGSVIVYNNPVHADVPIAAGWQPVHERRGFHPNQNTIVYRPGPACDAAPSCPKPEVSG